MLDTTDKRLNVATIHSQKKEKEVYTLEKSLYVF